MKLCCISDYHSRFQQVKPSSFEPHDVTLFAGDWTGPRKPDLQLKETVAFFEWLNQLPSKHKVLIAGNHDGTPILNAKAFQPLIAQYPSIHYLSDTSINIDGYNIYGTPFTPTFFDWYFMEHENELRKRWKRIPQDTHILLSHGPAFGILDETDHGTSAGSYALLQVIENLTDLKLHVFGHIHEAYGTHKGRYTSVNASQLNSMYGLENKPIYITLEDL